MTIHLEAYSACEPPPLGALLLLAREIQLSSLLAGAAAAAFLAGTFATLRLSMWQSHPERVLGKAGSPELRRRLEPLLASVETLVTSARVFELSAVLLFGGFVLRLLGGDEAGETWRAVLALSLSAPLLVLVTGALAQSFARRHGDAILVRFLPAFHVVQLPIMPLSRSFEALRKAVLRVLGVQEDPHSTRRIVEGLREVIADSEISGDLGETEREIIGNVMEFRDVDAAAVMTPRTEMHAADVADGVRGALEVLAGCGHSRIPVYEENLDGIIGTVTARDFVQVAARGELEACDLREILRPAYFVPETKRISELLSEFRREKIKYAIVLDEYGGTAGMVTLSDILEEIVGEILDEYDESAPEPVRPLGGGVFEVAANLHVSEVNEELDLDIPEEADYETLGGFVLAELGHFPQNGESFQRGDAEFAVAEANDRRVLKVRVRRLVPQRT